MLYFFYWIRLSFSVVGLECSFQMYLRANAFHNIIVKFNVVIKEFCLICIDFAQKFSRADGIVVHAKQTDLLMNSPLLLFVISFIFLFTFLTCTHQVFQFPYLSLFFYSHPSPVGCAQQEYRIWNSSCIYSSNGVQLNSTIFATITFSYSFEIPILWTLLCIVRWRWRHIINGWLRLTVFGVLSTD